MTTFHIYRTQIKIIGIIASYDMGWDQCATSRVYNLLSGHGYLIGCRFGCVKGDF